MAVHRRTRREVLRDVCVGGGLLAASRAWGAKGEESIPYIDVHTHLGRYVSWDKFLSAPELLRWMDRHGIERAVVLPLVSPESTLYLQPPEQVFEMVAPHGKRLIPFCSVDPRNAFVESKQALVDLLSRYKRMGAKGFGEHKVGLPFDHPLMMRVYEACSVVGLPLLFHIDTQRGLDTPGLPALRRALEAFPNLTFIGHGPGFWASISGGITPKELGGYPTGKIRTGGALDALLQACPNLYCDISAGSGANAFSRDLEFGRAFMLRWSDRILFGTDYLGPGQHVPQFELMARLDLPKDVRAKVHRENAIRILKLPA